MGRGTEYKFLPSFSAWLLDRIEEYVRYSLEILPQLELPMMEKLKHIPAVDLHTMSIESNKLFFKNLVDGTALVVEKESLKAFYKNQNPLLKADDIEIKDLIRAYQLREQVFRHFLQEYTNDFNIAFGVLDEINHFHGLLKEFAFEEMIGFKNQQVDQKNQLLEDAQQQAKLGYWYARMESDEIIWSDSLYDIFEIPRGTKVSAELITDLIAPEEKERARKQWEDSISQGQEISDLDFTIVTSSGSRKHLAGKSRMIFNHEGVPVESRGMFQDVSESRLQYLELQRNRSKLEEAQEIAHIGSWEYEIKTGKTIWTDEHYRLFGYTPGQKITVDDFFARILPEDLPLKRKRIEDALKSGEGYEEEYRLVMEDGSKKWIRSFTKVQVNPETGKAEKLFGTSQDITRIRVAQERLEKSQARLKEAQHIARIGSWEFDLSTDKIEWTREHFALFNLKPDSEITQDAWLSILQPEDAKKFQRLTEAALENGTSYQLRFKVNQNGRVHWFSTIGHAEKNPKTGKVERLFGTTQDITELVEKEQQLERLNEELEERVAARTKELLESNESLQHFAYIVSHDLKAPLRAIANISTFIETDYAGKLDDQGKEYLRLLSERTRLMEKLINDILEYSRAGGVKEESVSIDLNELVNRVVGDIDLGPGVKTEVNSLPRINAPFTPVFQIFQNLISNANKFVDPEEGKIKITCTQPNGHLHFCVEDNGPGIHPADHGKIFKLFMTLGDKQSGSGLGLAIVKKLIQRLNGDVWVESAEGSGARFCFTLPGDLKTH